MRSSLPLVFAAACMAPPTDVPDDADTVDTVDSAAQPADSDPGTLGALPTEACARTAPGTAPGDCLTDFTLPDATGGTHTLADHAGKVVLVDFSAVWCTTCRHLAPHGQELLDTYGADDLHVVTVLYESQDGLTPVADEDLTAWAEAFGLSHPVLADRDSALRDTFGGRERPLVIVADRDGRILQRLGADVSVIDATVHDAVQR